MKIKIALIIGMGILLICSVFFASKYFSAKKEIIGLKQELSKNKDSGSGKVLTFGQLFIEDVLEAEGEVDFETRLKLENAVRDLNDEELLNQWKLFIASQDEAGAQKEVRNLLKMLINKVGAEK